MIISFLPIAALLIAALTVAVAAQQLTHSGLTEPFFVADTPDKAVIHSSNASAVITVGASAATEDVGVVRTAAALDTVLDELRVGLIVRIDNASMSNEPSLALCLRSPSITMGYLCNGTSGGLSVQLHWMESGLIVRATNSTLVATDTTVGAFYPAPSAAGAYRLGLFASVSLGLLRVTVENKQQQFFGNFTFRMGSVTRDVLQAPPGTWTLGLVAGVVALLDNASRFIISDFDLAGGFPEGGTVRNDDVVLHPALLASTPILNGTGSLTMDDIRDSGGAIVLAQSSVSVQGAVLKNQPTNGTITCSFGGCIILHHTPLDVRSSFSARVEVERGFARRGAALELLLADVETAEPLVRVGFVNEQSFQMTLVAKPFQGSDEPAMQVPVELLSDSNSRLNLEVMYDVEAQTLFLSITSNQSSLSFRYSWKVDLGKTFAHTGFLAACGFRTSTVLSQYTSSSDPVLREIAWSIVDWNVTSIGSHAAPPEAVLLSQQPATAVCVPSLLEPRNNESALVMFGLHPPLGFNHSILGSQRDVVSLWVRQPIRLPHFTFQLKLSVSVLAYRQFVVDIFAAQFTEDRKDGVRKHNYAVPPVPGESFVPQRLIRLNPSTGCVQVLLRNLSAPYGTHGQWNAGQNCSIDSVEAVLAAGSSSFTFTVTSRIKSVEVLLEADGGGASPERATFRVSSLPPLALHREGERLGAVGASIAHLIPGSGIGISLLDAQLSSHVLRLVEGADLPASGNLPCFDSQTFEVDPLDGVDLTSESQFSLVFYIPVANRFYTVLMSGTSSGIFYHTQVSIGDSVGRAGGDMKSPIMRSVVAAERFKVSQQGNLTATFTVVEGRLHVARLFFKEVALPDDEDEDGVLLSRVQPIYAESMVTEGVGTPSPIVTGGAYIIVPRTGLYGVWVADNELVARNWSTADNSVSSLPYIEKVLRQQAPWLNFNITIAPRRELQPQSPLAASITLDAQAVAAEVEEKLAIVGAAWLVSGVHFVHFAFRTARHPENRDVDMPLRYPSDLKFLRPRALYIDREALATPGSTNLSVISVPGAVAVHHFSAVHDLLLLSSGHQGAEYAIEVTAACSPLHEGLGGSSVSCCAELHLSLENDEQSASAKAFWGTPRGRLRECIHDAAPNEVHKLIFSPLFIAAGLVELRFHNQLAAMWEPASDEESANVSHVAMNISSALFARANASTSGPSREATGVIVINAAHFAIPEPLSGPEVHYDTTPGNSGGSDAHAALSGDPAGTLSSDVDLFDDVARSAPYIADIRATERVHFPVEVAEVSGSFDVYFRGVAHDTLHDEEFCLAVGTSQRSKVGGFFSFNSSNPDASVYIGTVWLDFPSSSIVLHFGSDTCLERLYALELVRVLDRSPSPRLGANGTLTSATLPTGMLRCEDFDNGGPNVAYSMHHRPLHGPIDVLARPQDMVTVDRRLGLACTVGPGEWIRYSAGLPDDGDYYIELVAAGGEASRSAPPRLVVEANGEVLLTSLTNDEDDVFYASSGYMAWRLNSVVAQQVIRFTLHFVDEVAFVGLRFHLRHPAHKVFDATATCALGLFVAGPGASRALVQAPDEQQMSCAAPLSVAPCTVVLPEMPSGFASGVVQAADMFQACPSDGITHPPLTSSDLLRGLMIDFGSQAPPQDDADLSSHGVTMVRVCNRSTSSCTSEITIISGTPVAHYGGAEAQLTHCRGVEGCFYGQRSPVRPQKYCSQRLMLFFIQPFPAREMMVMIEGDGSAFITSTTAILDAECVRPAPGRTSGAGYGSPLLHVALTGATELLVNGFALKYSSPGVHIAKDALKFDGLSLFFTEVFEDCVGLCIQRSCAVFNYFDAVSPSGNSTENHTMTFTTVESMCIISADSSRLSLMHSSLLPFHPQTSRPMTSIVGLNPRVLPHLSPFPAPSTSAPPTMLAPACTITAVLGLFSATNGGAFGFLQVASTVRDSGSPTAAASTTLTADSLTAVGFVVAEPQWRMDSTITLQVAGTARQCSRSLRSSFLNCATLCAATLPSLNGSAAVAHAIVTVHASARGETASSASMRIGILAVGRGSVAGVGMPMRRTLSPAVGGSGMRLRVPGTNRTTWVLREPEAVQPGAIADTCVFQRSEGFDLEWCQGPVILRSDSRCVTRESISAIADLCYEVDGCTGFVVDLADGGASEQIGCLQFRDPAETSRSDTFGGAAIYFRRRILGRATCTLRTPPGARHLQLLATSISSHFAHRNWIIVRANGTEIARCGGAFGLHGGAHMPAAACDRAVECFSGELPYPVGMPAEAAAVAAFDLEIEAHFVSNTRGACEFTAITFVRFPTVDSLKPPPVWLASTDVAATVHRRFLTLAAEVSATELRTYAVSRVGLLNRCAHCTIQQDDEETVPVACDAFHAQPWAKSIVRIEWDRTQRPECRSGDVLLMYFIGGALSQFLAPRLLRPVVTAPISMDHSSVHLHYSPLQLLPIGLELEILGEKHMVFSVTSDPTSHLPPLAVFNVDASASASSVRHRFVLQLSNNAGSETVETAIPMLNHTALCAIDHLDFGNRASCVVPLLPSVSVQGGPHGRFHEIRIVVFPNNPALLDITVLAGSLHVTCPRHAHTGDACATPIQCFAGWIPQGAQNVTVEFKRRLTSAGPAPPPVRCPFGYSAGIVQLSMATNSGDSFQSQREHLVSAPERLCDGVRDTLDAYDEKSCTAFRLVSLTHAPPCLSQGVSPASARFDSPEACLRSALIPWERNGWGTSMIAARYIPGVQCTPCHGFGTVGIAQDLELLDVDETLIAVLPTGLSWPYCDSQLHCNGNGAVRRVTPPCECECFRGFTGRRCASSMSVRAAAFLMIRGDFTATESSREDLLDQLYAVLPHHMQPPRINIDLQPIVNGDPDAPPGTEQVSATQIQVDGASESLAADAKLILLASPLPQENVTADHRRSTSISVARAPSTPTALWNGLPDALKSAGAYIVHAWAATTVDITMISVRIDLHDSATVAFVELNISRAGVHRVLGDVMRHCTWRAVPDAEHFSVASAIGITCVPRICDILIDVGPVVNGAVIRPVDIAVDISVNVGIPVDAAFLGCAGITLDIAAANASSLSLITATENVRTTEVRGGSMLLLIVNSTLLGLAFIAFCACIVMALRKQVEKADFSVDSAVETMHRVHSSLTDKKRRYEVHAACPREGDRDVHATGVGATTEIPGSVTEGGATAPSTHIQIAVDAREKPQLDPQQQSQRTRRISAVALVGDVVDPEDAENARVLAEKLERRSRQLVERNRCYFCAFVASVIMMFFLATLIVVTFAYTTIENSSTHELAVLRFPDHEACLAFRDVLSVTHIRASSMCEPAYVHGRAASPLYGKAVCIDSSSAKLALTSRADACDPLIMSAEIELVNVPSGYASRCLSLSSLIRDDAPYKASTMGAAVVRVVCALSGHVRSKFDKQSRISHALPDEVAHRVLVQNTRSTTQLHSILATRQPPPRPLDEAALRSHSQKTTIARPSGFFPLPLPSDSNLTAAVGVDAMANVQLGVLPQNSKPAAERTIDQGSLRIDFVRGTMWDLGSHPSGEFSVAAWVRLTRAARGFVFIVGSNTMHIDPAANAHIPDPLVESAFAAAERHVLATSFLAVRGLGSGDAFDAPSNALPLLALTNAALYVNGETDSVVLLWNAFAQQSSQTHESVRLHKLTWSAVPDLFDDQWHHVVIRTMNYAARHEPTLFIDGETAGNWKRCFPQGVTLTPILNSPLAGGAIPREIRHNPGGTVVVGAMSGGVVATVTPYDRVLAPEEVQSLAAARADKRRSVLTTVDYISVGVAATELMVCIVATIISVISLVRSRRLELASELPLNVPEEDLAGKTLADVGIVEPTPATARKEAESDPPPELLLVGSSADPLSGGKENPTPVGEIAGGGDDGTRDAEVSAEAAQAQTVDTDAPTGSPGKPDDRHREAADGTKKETAKAIVAGSRIAVLSMVFVQSTSGLQALSIYLARFDWPDLFSDVTSGAGRIIALDLSTSFGLPASWVTTALIVSAFFMIFVVGYFTASETNEFELAVYNADRFVAGEASTDVPHPRSNKMLQFPLRFACEALLPPQERTEQQNKEMQNALRGLARRVLLTRKNAKIYSRIPADQLNDMQRAVIAHDQGLRAGKKLAAPKVLRADHGVHASLGGVKLEASLHEGVKLAYSIAGKPLSIGSEGGFRCPAHGHVLIKALREYHLRVPGKVYRCPHHTLHIPAFMHSNKDFYVCPSDACLYCVCKNCVSFTFVTEQRITWATKMYAMKRTSAIAVLGTITLSLLQLLHFPVTESALMVLMCHELLHCTLDPCYSTENPLFIFVALVAVGAIAIISFGLIMFEYRIAVQRRKIIDECSTLVGREALERRAVTEAPQELAQDVRTWWLLMLERDRTMFRSLYEAFSPDAMHYQPATKVAMLFRVFVIILVPTTLAKEMGVIVCDTLVLLLYLARSFTVDSWLTFFIRMTTVHQIAQLSLALIFDFVNVMVGDASQPAQTRSSFDTTTVGFQISMCMIVVLLLYLTLAGYMLIFRILIPLIRELRKKEELEVEDEKDDEEDELLLDESGNSILADAQVQTNHLTDDEFPHRTACETEAIDMEEVRQRRYNNYVARTRKETSELRRAEQNGGNGSDIDPDEGEDEDFFHEYVERDAPEQDNPDIDVVNVDSDDDGKAKSSDPSAVQPLVAQRESQASPANSFDQGETTGESRAVTAAAAAAAAARREQIRLMNERLRDQQVMGNSIMAFGLFSTGNSGAGSASAPREHER